MERETSGNGYEKIHDAMSFVMEVKPWALTLEADNGDVIDPLQINPAIARLVEVDDGIVMQAGFHDGAWRLIGYEWMAHYQMVEVDLEMSDEEFEKTQLEAEGEWEQRRLQNQQKNNDNCGLH